MMTTWSQCVLLVVEGLSGRPTLNSVESTCSQEELSSSLLRQLMVLLRLLWMIHFSFSWLCSVASLFCCFVVLLLRCSVASLFCCHNSACSSSRWKRSSNQQWKESEHTDVNEMMTTASQIRNPTTTTTMTQTDVDETEDHVDDD